jgi:hypothetical protein
MAEKGIEAIAYYCSVHHFGPDRWGIYFVEPLFYGFCAEVARRARHVAWDRVVTELWHAVDRHECFHAATELFALVAEDLMRTASTAGVAAPHGAHEWCVYGEAKAPGQRPGLSALEETFATAAEFREPVAPPSLRDALIEETRLLPRHYAAGLAYVQHDGQFDHGLFARALDRLSRDLIHTVGSGGGDRPPLARRWFPEVSPRALEAHGPIPRYAVS